jgi:hypothetical protein
LAISILGSVLSGTSKNESAWKKVYTQFKYYASIEQYTPHDYNGTIFAAIDLSLDHDENKMFSKDLMWSVLQALSLLRRGRDVPNSVVKLVWKSMRPEGEAAYFEAVVNSLIHKNLVDGSEDGSLTLHDLVREYLEVKKKPIDLITIICDQEGKLKQGRELLAIFLSLYAYRSIIILVDMVLGQAGAGFNEDYHLAWMYDHLAWMYHNLLDTDAENAILAVYQLSKATQQDAKALLHLMHGDECQALIAASVLVWLTINVGAENLLVDGDIEKIVWLCIHHLQDISIVLVFEWTKLILQLANCRVFAKKMICHKPLLILIVEKIQKKAEYHLEYVRILVALMLYVQGIKNTRPTSRVRRLFLSMGMDNTRVLEYLVDSINGATHCVEYGYVELLFRLEEPGICLWFEMVFEHMMRFFNHRVIFESISSNGSIHSLVSVLKHGTKEDVTNVPCGFKYLAIGHEEVALQLITEVGVEKVAEVVALWNSERGKMVELWLKHEGIAKGMILEGSICELLTRVIHQNSEVCMRVLSNLIEYHGDIVAEDLDAKGGLRLFLACYSMQPLNLTWIQLL